MLILPWPPSKLNPNQRIHFAQKAKIAGAYKLECWAIAKAESLDGRFLDGPIHVKLIFSPPDRRRRDLDNLLSSCKSGLDGICSAYGIDDTRFRPVTIDFGPINKPGRVIAYFEQ